MPLTNADDPLRTTDHEPSPAPPGRDVAALAAPRGAEPERAAGTVSVPEGGQPPVAGLSPAATVLRGPVTQKATDLTATTAETPPPDDKAGGLPTFPGYEMLDVLGRGGMGVVYKARHLALKRTVALKMVLAGGHAGPGELARFRIEAEAVARLQHPNIVQIHEVGEADGHPYCALEFVEGGNLAGQIGGKPMPAREAAKLVEALARAMQLAHSRNVVHRDLKPANVLLAADGTPKITDFGLARQLDSDSGATQAGAVMGTPSYMAPEQASGRAHEAGPAADVYALGAILYECLTGRPPFQGKTVVETLDQVRTQEPVPPSRFQAGVPLDVETICLKCLRKEPEKRYASAAELADDLVRYQRGEPIQARPVGRLERTVKWVKRNPVVTGLAVAVVVSLAVGTTVSYLKYLDAQQQQARAEAGERKATNALAIVESQRAEVEGSLSKAEAAEEAGRKLLYTTDMQLAPFLWRDDRTTAEQLRVLLASHIPNERKPDLRGFEWYYYQHLVEHSAAVFSGHGESVIDAAFTTEGPLVTLDQNGQVRRWDLASQQEHTRSRRDLPGGPSAQFRVLSPNGRLVALADGNKVRVFDTFTGKEAVQIDSASTQSRVGPNRLLIFSRDSDRLVIVDDKIRWLSAVNGQEIASVNRKLDYFYSWALSADGLTLAVVGQGDGLGHFSIFRLDATRRTVTPGAKGVRASGSLKASALSPDGQQIALGYTLNAGLSVYDTATGRLIAENRSAHASPITAIAFSGDGARLATADSEGTIKIWEDAQKLTSKGVVLLTLKGHQGAITGLAFSSDGRRLVSASVDKTARVWDLENAGAAIRPLVRADGLCLVARFSRNGQMIATAVGSSLRLWDAATGQLVRELSAGDEARIYSVAFSPADDRLLAVGYGVPERSGRAGISYVALWDIDAGTELTRLPGATDLPGPVVGEFRGAVAALAFSPDGKYLAAGIGTKMRYWHESYPDPLKVWEVATRRLIGRLNGHTGWCVSLAFSPDGTLLVSGGRDGRAIIWSTATWKATQRLQNPEPGPDMENQAGRGFVDDVAFSPDGKTLALASRSGNVQLWSVATGELLESLKGHSGAVSAIAFSPDGRTLASGGTDQTVRLWIVRTRRELMQLDAGSVELGSVVSLAFSPDGKHLLAGGSSRTAFWSAAPIVWNDPDRAAARLQVLLHSGADFQSRIRMLSENLRLHEALAKLDTNDRRARAALAAMQANWHASRQMWPEAVQAFDRLAAADPTHPEDWLRTPGLLRLATALLQQNRPRDATALLKEGAKRQEQDGVSAAVHDAATGKWLHPLRAAIDERLAKEPRNPGLLELRAELAGQWSDAKAQVADYTAAIDVLSRQAGEAAAVDLQRLYGRRGNAHVALQQWQQAVDDYARAVTDATTDEALLSNQVLARAELFLSSRSEPKYLAARKLTDPWQKVAAAYQLEGDQRAIDQLVKQRPKIAGFIGDLFTREPKKGWQRAVAIYNQGIAPETTDVDLLSKRARAYEALQKWDAAAADWSRAATGNPLGARLLAQFAQRLAAAGQVSLANGQFDKAHALCERSLAADPEDDVVATELAQLLWDKHETGNPSRWTVLKPTEMKSQGGATLTKLDDDSILAGGVNPRPDQYTVKFIIPKRTEIRSIRLEALTHDSLPGLGPGRGYAGDFYLGRWDVTVKGAGGADSPRSLNFHSACADYSANDAPLASWGEWNITTTIPGIRPQENHSSVWSLSEPDTLAAGAELVSHMRFQEAAAGERADQNLGRFRVSVSGDPAAFDREQARFAALKLPDPWAKLAAAYHAIGDQQALDSLLKHHPTAGGDLYLALQDWERAIAEYRKRHTDRQADVALLTKLATAYQSAGRTREGVAYLVKVSAANPNDTLLSLKVAALQAWFGQDKELAATRQRIRAFAKDTNDSGTAERAAKACSIRASTNKAELDAALALARRGVELGKGGQGWEWRLLAVGMAEYRCGNYAAAMEVLLAAAKAGSNNPIVTGISAFYRAMSLSRQGKPDEARKLAVGAAAQMKPLPKDEQNPLANNAYYDELILWLAYKEAKDLIKFDAAPAAPMQVQPMRK